MKTKTEYLKDLELTTLGDKKELKKHYRKLVKIYNLDNGTNKNELRIKEVHSAYEALSENKYKEERPLDEFLDNIFSHF
jgi:DnaJ-class molecular chaperone